MGIGERVGRGPSEPTDTGDSSGGSLSSHWLPALTLELSANHGEILALSVFSYEPETILLSGNMSELDAGHIKSQP